MVEIVAIPRHRHRCRGPRAASRRRARVGIPGEPHVVLLLDERQHFRLDELRVQARHRVVLEPALAALRVAAAVADGNRHHHRHAFLRNQIVERLEQQRIRSVSADDERHDRAGHVLLGDVHRDAARVRRRRACRHVELRRIVRIRGAECTLLAPDARIDFAVRRLHREVVDRALRARPDAPPSRAPAYTSAR